jgi:hypothetical protein
MLSTLACRTIARLDFQISHEQQIDDIERIVGLENHHGSTGGGTRNELAMDDGHFAAVGKVDREGPKRFCVEEFAKFLDRHCMFPEEPDPYANSRHSAFN